MSSDNSIRREAFVTAVMDLYVGMGDLHGVASKALEVRRRIRGELLDEALELYPDPVRERRNVTDLCWMIRKRWDLSMAEARLVSAALFLRGEEFCRPDMDALYVFIHYHWPFSHVDDAVEELKGMLYV